MRTEALVAFLAMAAVSYAIRLAGFQMGGALGRQPRLKRALDQLPAAILIALVVPQLAHAGPAEWGAALLVLGAACYFDQLLAPLLIGVLSVVALRSML